MSLSDSAPADVATAMYQLHRRVKRGLLGFSAKEIDSLSVALADVKAQIVENGHEFTRQPENWDRNLIDTLTERIDPVEENFPL